MITIQSFNSTAYYDEADEELTSGLEGYLGQGGQVRALYEGDLARKLGIEGAEATPLINAYLRNGFDPNKPWPDVEKLTQNASRKSLEYDLLTLDRKSAKARADDPSLPMEERQEAAQFLKATKGKHAKLEKLIKETEDLREARQKKHRELEEAKKDGDTRTIKEREGELSEIDKSLKGKPGGARGGIELTYSPPKSVSMLRELAPPEMREKIDAVLLEAERKSIENLIERAAISRTGKGEAEAIIKASGVIKTRYGHDSARPTEESPLPDMDFHGHWLVFSPVLCEDGKTRALLSDEINNYRMAADAEYQALLARGLNELGIKTVAVELGEKEVRSFRVAGISRDQEWGFSKRAREIEAELKRRAEAGLATDKEIAKLGTRLGKSKLPEAEIRAEWGRQMAAAGLDYGTVAQAEPSVGEKEKEYKPKTDAELVEELVEGNNYFTEYDLLNAVWRDAIATGDTEGAEKRVARIIGSRELLAVTDDKREELARLSVGKTPLGKPIFTTRSQVIKEMEVEKALGRMTQGVWGNGKFGDAAEAVRRVEEGRGTDDRPFRYREDQKLLIQQAIGSGQAFFIQAKAGTGKTTALGGFLGVAEAAGMKTFVLAPSNSATEIAAADTGKTFGEDCLTVSKFLLDARTPDGFEARSGSERKIYGEPRDGGPMIDANTVICVDEASMISLTQAQRLLELAERAGAKIIFQGDRNQLPSVSAGRFFANAVEGYGVEVGIGGAPVVGRLSVINRQRAEWMRECVEFASESKWAEVIKAFDEKGKIREAGTREELIAKVADDHCADGHEARQKIILGTTNADVDAANAAVRSRLKQSGALGEGRKILAFDGERTKETEFAVGERIIFKEKAKAGGRGPALAQKSQLGTVEGIRTEDGRTVFSVRVDGKERPVEIDPERVEMGHGYAITVHKSQGLTVENARFIYNGKFISTELGYVGLSRHRNDCEVYCEATDRAAMERNLKRSMLKFNAGDLIGEERLAEIRDEFERGVERRDLSSGLFGRGELPVWEAAALEASARAVREIDAGEERLRDLAAFEAALSGEAGRAVVGRALRSIPAAEFERAARVCDAATRSIDEAAELVADLGKQEALAEKAALAKDEAEAVMREAPAPAIGGPVAAPEDPAKGDTRARVEKPAKRPLSATEVLWEQGRQAAQKGRAQSPEQKERVNRYIKDKKLSQTRLDAEQALGLIERGADPRLVNVKAEAGALIMGAMEEATKLAATVGASVAQAAVGGEAGSEIGRVAQAVKEAAAQARIVLGRVDGEATGRVETARARLDHFADLVGWKGEKVEVVGLLDFERTRPSGVDLVFIGKGDRKEEHYFASPFGEGLRNQGQATDGERGKVVVLDTSKTGDAGLKNLLPTMEPGDGLFVRLEAEKAVFRKVVGAKEAKAVAELDERIGKDFGPLREKARKILPEAGSVSVAAYPSHHGLPLLEEAERIMEEVPFPKMPEQDQWAILRDAGNGVRVEHVVEGARKWALEYDEALRGTRADKDAFLAKSSGLKGGDLKGFSDLAERIEERRSEIVLGKALTGRLGQPVGSVKLVECQAGQTAAPGDLLYKDARGCAVRTRQGVGFFDFGAHRVGTVEQAQEWVGQKGKAFGVFHGLEHSDTATAWVGLFGKIGGLGAEPVKAFQGAAQAEQERWKQAEQEFERREQARAARRARENKQGLYR